MKKALVILILALFVLPGLMAEKAKVELELRWEISKDRLIIIVQGPSKGRISVALGAESDISGANVLVAWVDDMMGIAMGEDHFGTGPEEHKNDMELGGSQNIQVLAGRQTEDMTEVTFAIPLITDDEYDIPLEAGKSYPVIISCTDSDLPDGNEIESIQTLMAFH